MRTNNKQQLPQALPMWSSPQESYSYWICCKNDAIDVTEREDMAFELENYHRQHHQDDWRRGQ
jgi:sRNA-binding protein